jgi:hypothetical protein
MILNLLLVSIGRFAAVRAQVVQIAKEAGIGFRNAAGVVDDDAGNA